MYNSSFPVGAANVVATVGGDDPIAAMAERLMEVYCLRQQYGWSLETARRIHRIEAEVVINKVPPERRDEYIELRAGGRKLAIPHALEQMSIAQ